MADNLDMYAVGIHCANCNANGWTQVPKGKLLQAMMEKECPNCGVKGYVHVR
jgi:DNA-directed RNA polymerase subunit RPC12/RpoP